MKGTGILNMPYSHRFRSDRPLISIYVFGECVWLWWRTALSIWRFIQSMRMFAPWPIAFTSTTRAPTSFPIFLLSKTLLQFSNIWLARVFLDGFSFFSSSFLVQSHGQCAARQLRDKNRSTLKNENDGEVLSSRLNSYLHTLRSFSILFVRTQWFY